MKSKKKILFIASAACLVGLLFLLNDSPKKIALQVSKQQNDETLNKTTRMPASLSTVELKPSAVSSLKEVDPLEEKIDTKLIKQTLDIYKDQGQYHFTTLPLDNNKTENPLLRHYQNKSFWQGALEGDNLRARLLSDKEFYSQEEEALLSVESTWKGQTAQAILKATLLTLERENLGELNFSSDSKFSLPLKNLKDGFYLVQVEATIENEKVNLLKSFSLQKGLPQFLSMTSSELTAEKDLTLMSKWKVKKESYYLVEAVLSDEKGIPIAAYEEAIPLKEGEQNITLKFDGFWFYKKKHQGKMVLSQLSLSQIDEALEINRGPLIEPRYQTKSYSWESFRSTPNPDPVLQEKIKSLEAKISSL